jgi:MFS transporter, DHA2 family, multidrug resistance protein
MDTNTTTGGPRAGRREWLGLVVLTLPALLIAMDLSVLYLAVPNISADLQPSSAELLWITDIYGFMLAGFLITMGTLGDRIGRRKLLMIGGAAFGIASVIAAYSTSAEMLIASRALLGVAGATLGPSALALVSNTFRDDKQRSFAIAIWVTALSAGGAMGPLLGGVLLEWFWWGAAFLIGVPVMVMLLVAAPFLLPEYRDTSAGRLDLTSVALSLGTILPVIYGLKQIAQDGLRTTPIVAILVGLAVGLVFVRRQRRLADPLIDLGLFRRPAFSVSLAANTFTFFIFLGVMLFVAQYLQLVLGLSPLVAGLWTVPIFIAFIVGSMLSPMIMGRFRPATSTAAGFAVTAVGFAMLTQVSGDSALAVLVAGSVVLSLGLAPVVTSVTTLVLGSAPPEKAGAASGMSETSTEFGGALGIAILGVVGTAVYRGQIADAVPAGVPADAVEATRDTLGGAVAAAGQLPDDVAAALLGPARDAFTSALHAVSGLAALIAFGLAVLTAVLLRNVGPAGGAAEPAGEPGEPAEANATRTPAVETP